MHRIDVAQNIFTARDSKTLWGALNELKIKQVRVVGNISVQDWVRHFQQLLNPPLTAGMVANAQPFIRDQFLNSGFSPDELNSVIHKIKPRKAPGCDGVPYEYFKNGPNLFLSKLLVVYNNIYKSHKIPDSFKKNYYFPL